ncbi:WapI family immunity protein [Spirosoma agri]|uniref:Uncharacterized protein n=1 Tax=Spirosoma agri TaxID=1987381 RepID=A0A6M0IS88_9BACT|nr:hypothetical protein [Spirosoma agri]NEU70882.1 hypothetical protein [Spirosoma agri]
MLIENEIKTRFIQLVVVESELHYYPTFKLSIQLKTEEITAKFDRSIWVSEVDVQNFIQQLEALDKSRNGKAKLSGMSPNDFDLIIENLDTLGHLSVCLSLKRESSLILDYKDSLKVCFEIDPTSIPSIKKSFTKEMTV